MADSVERTSISLDGALLKKGQARAKRLRYRNFSEYVAFLIERDLTTLEHHLLIREDPDVPEPTAGKRNNRA